MGSQSLEEGQVSVESGNISGAKRKGSVRRFKPLPRNGSEDVTVGTSACV
jgi:hypothetical protein